MTPANRVPATSTDHADRAVRRMLVVSKTEVAVGVAALTLVADDGGTLPAWCPGAHIELRLGNGLCRQYSLCGDPADREQWRIAVLREPRSRGGSVFVHERLDVGGAVEVCGPRNHFPLHESPGYLFVAGGIGITPILPMIARADATGADWQLVYGGRRRESMAFLPNLARYGDRVRLWPEDECGRIELGSLLGTSRQCTLVYCCGPAGLLDAVEQRCSSWPMSSLHVERFAPSAPPAARGEDAPFRVHCERSGVTVEVGADQTIADAVEAAGVLTCTSCREGVCGTCETAVLEGVPDHRDEVLTSAERESCDVIMICVSRARSAELRLEL
jgi:ferredoxin-NADP reductase